MSAVLFIGRERPGLDLFWLDSNGDPLDLTTDNWSFTVTIEQADVVSQLDAHITPQANPTIDNGSASDVPTMKLTFNPNSLDSLIEGPAILRVAASHQGRDRLWKQTIRVES